MLAPLLWRAPATKNATTLWILTITKGLARYFARLDTERPTHTWTRQICDGSLGTTADLASELADRIVELHCRGAPQYYTEWTQRAAGKSMLSPAAEAFLRAVSSVAIGLPTS